MKFLITTTSGFYYYNGTKTKKIFNGYFFGLTWDENFTYVCQNIVGPSFSTNLLVLDKNLKLVRKKKFPNIVHVHQALYDRFTDQIYICNTGKDKIVILDPKTLNIKKQVGFSKKDTDTVHLNSIFCTKDKAYVCLHNRWTKHKKPSKLIVANKDLDTLDSFTAGKGCHNIYVKENQLYFCSSEESKVLTCNLKQKKITEKIFKEEASYLRGMSKTKDQFLFAFSQVAPRAVRSKKTNFGVVITCSNNFKVISRNKINAVGQIHDIRIVDDIDLCHNEIKLRIDY